MTDEQRKRIHAITYSTQDREELAERIVKLEDVAAGMYSLMDESCAVQHPYAPEPIRYDTLIDVYEKLRELGIEVGE